MFKLTPDSLDNALKALQHHGYGDFFPEPPEMDLLAANWATIQQDLSSVDLDVYQGYDRVYAFAPKSRLNVRSVSLLHPYDLLCFTALVLDLRDGVTAARATSEKRVFSYRAEGAGDGILYLPVPGYSEFKKATEDRLSAEPGLYVGVTDIADFYPRIYQHRLVNALQAACGSTKHDQIRVLEKMLARVSGGASYGIPVGPAASRVLGEAVLIDVDSTLLSNDVDFTRFTDDYVIFSSDPEGAEFGIRILGETLFLNHGLTLQTAKTRVMPGTEYLERYLQAHDEKERKRRELIRVVGQYDQQLSYDQLDTASQAKIDAMNLSEMLKESLEQGHNVDFREVSFILGGSPRCSDRN
jgi:hypothetical protein